jgi:hypothetical protein
VLFFVLVLSDLVILSSNITQIFFCDPEGVSFTNFFRGLCFGLILCGGWWGGGGGGGGAWDCLFSEIHTFGEREKGGSESGHGLHSRIGAHHSSFSVQILRQISLQTLGVGCELARDCLQGTSTSHPCSQFRRSRFSIAYARIPPVLFWLAN